MIDEPPLTGECERVGTHAWRWGSFGCDRCGARWEPRTGADIAALLERARAAEAAEYEAAKEHPRGCLCRPCSIRQLRARSVSVEQENKP